jgi:hypothetical protein
MILGGSCHCVYCSWQLASAGLATSTIHPTPAVLCLLRNTQLSAWAPTAVVSMCMSAVSRGLPVPHIGWNTLEQLRASDLLAAAAPSDRVYYVHSYR